VIGIATWNFVDGTLAERIDRFAGMGFEAVSLLARHAAEMARGETPDVEEAITANSLGVAIHGGMMSKAGSLDESALLSDFEAFLDWHSRTGALNTVNYDAASVCVEGQSVYDAKGMRSVLGKMLEMSNGAGFTVGVEDWPRDAEMLEAVADLLKFNHYGVLIDLGHMNMRIHATEAPYPIDRAQAYLDDIRLPINELHIHNNDGAHDQHCPLDRGTADFDVVARMLRPRCASTLFTMEIAPQLCGLSEEVCIEGSVAALARWRLLFST
jgi:sugar phosphate isomerase/epimerase